MGRIFARSNVSIPSIFRRITDFDRQNEILHLLAGGKTKTTRNLCPVSSNPGFLTKVSDSVLQVECPAKTFAPWRIAGCTVTFDRYRISRPGRATAVVDVRWLLRVIVAGCITRISVRFSNNTFPFVR